jgi:hypothetical protein
LSHEAATTDEPSTEKPTMTKHWILASIATLTLGTAAFVSPSFAGDGCPACKEKAAAAAKENLNWVAFGEPMKQTDDQNVDAAKVLNDIAKYEGQTVRMVGTVKSVCAKKGCWLRMTSPGTDLSIFVHFNCPIDGRLIPMEAVDRPVKVEGKVTIKEISEEDARHIAEEEGKSKEDIAKIVGPQKLLEMEGPSALVGMPVEEKKQTTDAR